MQENLVSIKNIYLTIMLAFLGKLSYNWERVKEFSIGKGALKGSLRHPKKSLLLYKMYSIAQDWLHASCISSIYGHYLRVDLHSALKTLTNAEIFTTILIHHKCI